MGFDVGWDGGWQEGQRGVGEQLFCERGTRNGNGKETGPLDGAGGLPLTAAAQPSE
jgi:hypothetical protein